MRRLVVGCVVLLAITLAVAGSGLFWWSRVIMVVGAAAGLLLALRCRHPHPALQPPLQTESGERHHARWYCDDCGRSWPAVFERDRAPVLKYAGFDQAKAPEAERRARMLDVRRRELALDRAGLRQTAASTQPVVMRPRADRAAGESPWRTPPVRTPLELLHTTPTDATRDQ
jgi:hypothetical protein